MENVFKEMITRTNGKFFTVEFVKKDGSIRKMNCRTGVTRHLRAREGVGSSTAHIEKYVTVYDVHAKGYRTINVDQLRSFKCGKMVFNLGI